ncbi:MAG: HIT family protein [Candidatus Harrisonbacteria bacterium]|nr:HIT family protein [Candidatus Harrisonbacteria bacterium]
MADCLFCKIGRKEIASEVIYEDDFTLAFLDVHPKAPGHTMVIPKNHSENLLDLEDNLAAPVLLTVKKVTGILAKAFKPDGFTIGINHGRAGGQVVDHLHIHVIPRFSGDGGKSIHSVVDNPPKEPLKDIAEKIKKQK